MHPSVVRTFLCLLSGLLAADSSLMTSNPSSPLLQAWSQCQARGSTGTWWSCSQMAMGLPTRWTPPPRRWWRRLPSTRKVCNVQLLHAFLPCVSVLVTNVLFPVNQCRDSSVVRAPDSWFERSRVRIPAGSVGEFSSPRVSFLCWLLFRYLSDPRVIAVAHKRPRSFRQKCRWQVTAS